MNRDTYSQIRLPRAPSSLALTVSRNGASTTSLGNLFQCLTTLTIEDFFVISNLNLPSLSLKPFPLFLSTQTLLKSLSSSFLYLPFNMYLPFIRSPQSLLFSRLNSPSSLSLSLKE